MLIRMSDLHYGANACYGHPNSCRAEACDGGCICGLGAPR
jgi:hypothetical protein